jgi:hypothetical protein
MSQLTAVYPEPEAIWRDYVGDLSPLEFLQRQGASSVEACVVSYVDLLPRFEGIVRSYNWPLAFRSEYQLRAAEVIRGLLEHIEHHRETWESVWTAPPARAAAPVTQEVPPVLPPEDDVAPENVDEPAIDLESDSESPDEIDSPNGPDGSGVPEVEAPPVPLSD